MADELAYKPFTGAQEEQLAALVLGGGGGVTVHSLLTGLLLDDHTQYHTDARGDVRYSLLAHNHDGAYATLGHNHTGVYQPLATALTNTTAAFTTAQESKLAGVASGATANSSDATLLARANHTGTQPAASISGLAVVATTGAYADLSGLPTLGTAAALNVPAAGDAAAGEVVRGTDTRLTDARAPTAHTHTAAAITDFDTQVRTNRLDQMAAPTASVNFGGQQATSFRIENRTSDPASPTVGQLWLRTDL